MIQWIIDHKEQILAVVKIIMTLLAAFGEGDIQATAVPTGPPPPMLPSEVAYLDEVAFRLAA